jgi:hypothetical protein
MNVEILKNKDSAKKFYYDGRMTIYAKLFSKLDSMKKGQAAVVNLDDNSRLAAILSAYHINNRKNKYRTRTFGKRRWLVVKY